MTGNLTFAAIGHWPSVSTDIYPINSAGLSWSGASDGAKIFYRLTASDAGNLVF
jgi:hypothetical protein